MLAPAAILSEFSAALHDPLRIEPHRLVPGAFTRQRKLPLPRVLAMMVGGMCASVQTELDALFAQLHHSTVRIRGASRQAFAKLRGGFSATLFDALNAHLLTATRPLIDAQRWHGLRVVAATGLTHLAFQQDFAAKIVADNLHTLLAAAHDEAMTEADVVATSRPNRTYALGALKPILAGCLLGLHWCLRDLSAALDTIVRTRCRIQPGRSYPRPPRTKPHLHSAYRTVC